MSCVSTGYGEPPRIDTKLHNFTLFEFPKSESEFASEENWIQVESAFQTLVGLCVRD